MKKYILPFLALFLLTACEKSSTKSEPEPQPTKTPKASFTVTTQHPFTAVFNNTSSYANSYVWNFGDGKTSTERNPKHRYAEKGVYKVTLTAKNLSGSNSFSKNVTIENPSKCYVSGCCFVDIPWDDEYYRIRLTDDYDVYATTFVKTNWKLLSSANIPYRYIFSDKVELTEYQNKGYRVWMDMNDTNSGNGTELLNVKIEKNAIWTNYPDSLTCREQGIDWIRIYFTWK